MTRPTERRAALSITPLSPSPVVRRRRRPAALAGAVAVGLLLGAVGCSDGDDDEPALTTTTVGEATSDGGGGATDPTGDDTTSPTDGGAGSTTTVVAVDPASLPELDDVEQPFADALVADFADSGGFIAGADTVCLSTHWVDLIGAEAFTASGLSPEEFADDGPPAVGIDRATAEAMVDVMDECGAGPDRLYEAFATGFDGNAQVNPDVLSCLRDEVPEDMLREAMVATFLGDDEGAMNAIEAQWEACTPEAG